LVADDNAGPVDAMQIRAACQHHDR
jgi:hypothetical protein